MRKKSTVCSAVDTPLLWNYRSCNMERNGYDLLKLVALKSFGSGTGRLGPNWYDHRMKQLLKTYCDGAVNGTGDTIGI